MFHFSGVICLYIICLSICKSLRITEVWTFSSLGYVEIARLHREFTRSQFSCVHFRTRTGHTTLQLQAITLELLATKVLQNVPNLSPVDVATTAVSATKHTFSADEGWRGVSYDCGTPRCSAHGWCGMRIPQCGRHGWCGTHVPRCSVCESILPGLPHVQAIPNGFLCNVWSAVNRYTRLCNFHTNRTSAFYRNWTDPITATWSALTKHYFMIFCRMLYIAIITDCKI